MWRASTGRITPRIRNGYGQLQSWQQMQCRRCTSGQKSEPAKPTLAMPPPPPPPAPAPRKRSIFGLLFKLVGVGAVGAGGVVAYAYYSPEFREKVEDYIPLSREALHYIYSQVLPDHDEAWMKTHPVPSQTKLKTPASNKAEQAEEKGLARTIRVPEPPAEKPAKTEVSKVKEKQAEPSAMLTKAEVLKKEKEDAKKAELEKKKREKELVERRIQEKEAEEAAENAALEVILEGVLDKAVKITRVAIEAQEGAVAAARTHTKELKTAMDDSEAADKESQWAAVAQAHDLKVKAIERAEEFSQKAQEQLEKVKHAIEEGKSSAITKKNKALRSAEETLNTFVYNLSKAEGQMKKTQAESQVLAEYKDLIQKGREQFKKELESIMPDVKIGQKRGKKLTEDELNSLIAHAHRRVEQLQKQLAEQQAMEQQRIQVALERQQEEDEKLADGRVAREGEKLLGAFNLEKEKWETEAYARYEVELRHQLARQAAAHSDHLADVLRVQKQEMLDKFDTMLNEKLIEERETFQFEVAGWIARLKGIEAAVEARAELEKQGRKAQELWLACQTLQVVLMTGKEGAAIWEEKVKPLANELMAIKEAGNSHPYVTTVVEAIPEDAVQRGVWTEESLRERFQKVRKVCRRVAMIDETGGSLFKHFVSFVQSLFVFSTMKPIGENEEIDPKDINTFMLMDNAAHSLDKGDLEQAIKYVNQLDGAPRRLAADWLKEARLLLETKQAADALLAHASASGLGSLF